ncbi:hypothetical protein HYY74_01855 [Candidatus Woesearchaeota archaeon]|nr:hypothetical protein [Candidatus Woesearchaeota archaeon]
MHGIHHIDDYCDFSGYDYRRLLALKAALKSQPELGIVDFRNMGGFAVYTAYVRSENLLDTEEPYALRHIDDILAGASQAGSFQFSPARISLVRSRVIGVTADYYGDVEILFRLFSSHVDISSGRRKTEILPEAAFEYRFGWVPYNAPPVEVLVHAGRGIRP